MEGDLLDDSFNVEEEGGGETDYSLSVNGVIGVSCIDWFLQPGDREGMFPNKSPSRQEMLVPLSIRAWVPMAFKVCNGSIS